MNSCHRSIDCDGGSFNPLQGARNCTICMANAAANDARTQCTCLPNYYSIKIAVTAAKPTAIDSGLAFKCVKCPETLAKCVGSKPTNTDGSW